MNENSTTSLVTYTLNKDEEQVARHIQKFYLLGDLTMVIFLDSGHKILLDILINEMRLLNMGMTGLVSEQDLSFDIIFTLRLDSTLFTYIHEGNTIILREAYAVNKKKKLDLLGTWSESTGLMLPEASIWDRRSNLEGLSITVATISWPPMTKLYYDPSNESVVDGRGLFLDPLNILAKKLNFTINFILPADRQWGALTKNNSWTGMIGTWQQLAFPYQQTGREW